MNARFVVVKCVESKGGIMRKFYAALVMVAVATASFAFGRSTSSPVPIAALTGENVASIDVSQLQSVSRDLPELPADTQYHGYLVFPPDR
jgi:hypothetical protein